MKISSLEIEQKREVFNGMGTKPVSIVTYVKGKATVELTAYGEKTDAEIRLSHEEAQQLLAYAQSLLDKRNERNQ